MKKLLIFSVVLGIMLAAAGFVNAAELRVNDDGTANFDTIQDAIDSAAVSGDTIIVEGGTYDEQITINGKDISLIADDSLGDVIIQPTSCIANPIKKHIIQIYDSTATVEGFTIDANYATSGCLDGIYAKGGRDGYDFPVDVTIENNDIYNYGKNGITVNGAEANACIKDNSVTGRGVLTVGDHAQNGIQLGYGATGTIEGNEISYHDYDGFWAGTGILLYNVNQKILNLPVPVLEKKTHSVITNLT